MCFLSSSSQGETRIHRSQDLKGLYMHCVLICRRIVVLLPGISKHVHLQVATTQRLRRSMLRCSIRVCLAVDGL